VSEVPEREARWLVTWAYDNLGESLAVGVRSSKARINDRVEMFVCKLDSSKQAVVTPFSRGVAIKLVMGPVFCWGAPLATTKIVPVVLEL
jgi:hypothetical protein